MKLCNANGGAEKKLSIDRTTTEHQINSQIISLNVCQWCCQLYWPLSQFPLLPVRSLAPKSSCRISGQRKFAHSDFHKPLLAGSSVPDNASELGMVSPKLATTRSGGGSITFQWAIKLHAWVVRKTNGFDLPEFTVKTKHDHRCCSSVSVSRSALFLKRTKFLQRQIC